MPPTIITKESLYKRISELERKHCCNKNQFFDTFADFPAEGQKGILYIDESTGDIYVWVVDAFVVAGDKFHSNIVATTSYDPLNPLTGWTAPAGAITGNTVEVKFTDGVLGNYTYDGSGWVQDFLVYSLGEELVSPYNLWSHTQTFANGNETNPIHWDLVGSGVRHKAARSALAYRDRLAQSASLDKDQLYRVSWDVSDYISGGISLNIGESFTKESYANGSYVDYVVASSDDLISIQSIPPSNLIISNISVRKVISPNLNVYGKLSVKGTLSTDGYIETGKNKRIQIGYWDNGTNYKDDVWQIHENTQPSISIGYNSMTRGTGVCIGPNAGRDNTNLGYITAFGVNALKSNTIGHATAVGTGAGQNNTTGNLSAFGDECLALAVNTNNNGFGYYTLHNTTGNFNAAFGHESCRLMTTGENNSAFGYQSMMGVGSGTGTWNCAFGANSLRDMTSASGNVAIGFNCMVSNNTGGFNVGIGFAALGKNTSGDSNTAAGQFAMRLNTTGSKNTAFGSQTLWNNLTGSDNIAIGHNSLYNLLTSFNIGIGSESLSSMSSGTYNISIGINSGKNLVNDNPLTTSNNSIFIGSETRSFSDNQTNEIVIGYGAFGFGTNTATIGNDNIIQTNLKGIITLKTQFPTSGTGVANGSLFYGTNGALYFKGGSGTVTQIAVP